MANTQLLLDHAKYAQMKDLIQEQKSRIAILEQHAYVIIKREVSTPFGIEISYYFELPQFAKENVSNEFDSWFRRTKIKLEQTQKVLTSFRTLVAEKKHRDRSLDLSIENKTYKLIELKTLIGKLRSRCFFVGCILGVVASSYFLG